MVEWSTTPASRWAIGGTRQEWPARNGKSIRSTLIRECDWRTVDFTAAIIRRPLRLAPMQRTAEEDSSTPRPTRKPLARPVWWLRECIAIALWIAFLTKVFVYDFDVHLLGQLAPDYLWLLNYRFFAILAAIAILCVLLRRSWFRRSVLYVLLYPLVVLFWHMPRVAFRHWAIAIAFAPALHSLIVTFRKTFLWTTIAILSAFSIAVFDNAYVVIISMSLLLLFLLRHFALTFHRAFRPSTVFTDLAGLVRKSWSLMEDRLFGTDFKSIHSLDPDSEEYSKKYKSNLFLAYLCNSSLLALAVQLRRVAASRKLDVYFISTLLITIVYTVVVFSFEYYGLFTISPQSFSPSTELGFLDFLGFSFSTLMTAGISAIAPTDAWSQLLCYLELVAFVLIVFIVATVLLTVARERYSEHIEQVIRELRSTAKAIEAIVEQDYQLTYAEFEAEVVKDSLKFVNTMRKLRELPEIPAPANGDDDAQPSDANEASANAEVASERVEDERSAPGEIAAQTTDPSST
ncbi:MAG: hypothetical protein RIC55_27785 [Pirellulaceae bacterium]